MFMSSKESMPSPYPMVDELRLDVVYAQSYGWGKVHFTEQAISAYELDLGEHEDDTIAMPPTEGFAADVLVAGPDELIVPRRIPAIGGATMYRQGARITVGLTADKDMYGMSLTSHTLEGITSQLPQEHVPEFLKDYGEDVQDHTKAHYPHVVAHALTELSTVWSFNSYMSWKSAEDRRGTIRSLNRENLLFLGSGAVMNAWDLAGDGKIEPVVGLADVVLLAAMALTARSHLKHELASATDRHTQNTESGMRLARRVSQDMHDLLCPGKDAA